LKNLRDVVTMRAPPGNVKKKVIGSEPRRKAEKRPANKPAFIDGIEINRF